MTMDGDGRRMRRIIIWIASIVVAVPLTLLCAVWLLLASKGRPYVVRAATAAPHRFDARTLLVATDADMVGTSYADGILHPLSGAYDAVSRVALDEKTSYTSEATITNSVTSWPGTLELSPNGQHAYVIESRGPAPAGVDRVRNVHKDLAVGRLLTTIDVGSGARPSLVRQDDIAVDPTSVHVAPQGAWLIVAARDARFPITFVILEGACP
jgi:hypothetical protein